MSILSNILVNAPFKSTFVLGSQVWEISFKENRNEEYNFDVCKISKDSSGTETYHSMLSKQITESEIDMEFIIKMYSQFYSEYQKETFKYVDDNISNNPVIGSVSNIFSLENR